MKNINSLTEVLILLVLFTLLSSCATSLHKALPLHYAVKEKDANKVKHLITSGADVNGKDDYGLTPLHFAAEYGYEELAELLISKGADIDAMDDRGWTPLHVAVDKGYTSVIKLLIEKGATVNGKNENDLTPLHFAVKVGSLDTAEFLIANGAGVNVKAVNGNSPLHVAVYNSRVSIVKFLIAEGAEVDAKDYEGKTPIHIAAQEGHKAIAEVLITGGADVNAMDDKGYIPLQYAVDEGRNDVIEILIAKGADVNVKATNSSTVLHYAIVEGDISLVELLISKGADVNARGLNGVTPLHVAVIKNNQSISELLIADGADVNAKAEVGKTALHYAARYGHTDIAGLLITSGADVNGKDDYGLTPLHFAAEFGYRATIEILIAKGADIAPDVSESLKKLTESPWVVTREAILKIQENYVSHLSNSDLLRKTIYKMNEVVAKSLSIEEYKNKLKLTCKEKSIVINFALSDIDALIDQFVIMRPIVKLCVEDEYKQEFKYNYGNLCLKQLLSSLDPNSYLLTPDMFNDMVKDAAGTNASIGIQMGIRDGILTIIFPIMDTPAFRAGLEAGDVIVKIEDESTKDMTIMDAVKRLRGEPGTDVTIWVVREGWTEPKSFTITRDIIKIKSVRWKVLEKGYGYIKVNQFPARTNSELEKAIKAILKEESEIRGLILDLRNNPSGLLDQAVKVADMFIDSGLIVYTDGRREDQKFRYTATDVGTYKGFPMIVLVNAGSASASETVAGALQDHDRAKVVGVPTYGYGSIQTIFPLGDGSALRLTTAMVLTGKGNKIDGVGIQPDMVVSDENGMDIQLEEGLRVLKTMVK